MNNPPFVTLNGHRIKVQRWQQNAGVMTFTTVIRGEHLGHDIVNAMQLPDVSLVLDDERAFTGSARLLDRRASGAGTTAVIRLEIQFTIDPDSGLVPELTQDEKLDAILAELRALRREVAALRTGSPSQNATGIAPTRPGTTLLDFEIPVEDDPA